jgi:hypothetical protein
MPRRGSAPRDNLFGVGGRRRDRHGAPMPDDLRIEAVNLGEE